MSMFSLLCYNIKHALSKLWSKDPLFIYGELSPQCNFLQGAENSIDKLYIYMWYMVKPTAGCGVTDKSLFSVLVYEYIWVLHDCYFRCSQLHLLQTPGAKGSCED